jgi:hypothetical protein
MASATKGARPLLSQLDLAKSQYAGIVEDHTDCLTALYLEIKRIFLKAKRKCMMQCRKPEEILGGGGANNGNRNGTTTGKFRKPSAGEKNRRTIDGNVMFYHKKTERRIPDRFPLGSKVTQEAVDVATVPLATPTIVGVPPVQINTAISDGHSKTFTKDEIYEMK